MNTQLRQYFARAKPFRLKKARFCLARFCLAFLFPKIARSVKKARISKSGFKKAKLAIRLVIRKQHWVNRETVSIVEPQ